MKKYSAILATCPLFQGISEEELSALLGCLGARVSSAEKNELIFREGDPARFVGIVLTGQVQVIREDYYGNRTILSRIGPGQLFGESFACANVGALPVSVEAVEKSEVMLIDCRRLTQTCGSACAFHSKMIFHLMNIMATKNLAFHRKLEVTSKRTTREKLMTYLLLQAKEQGSDHFTIPFDRQALADYLEVDRSGLSAEISKLRAEGVLENRKSTFTLL